MPSCTEGEGVRERMGMGPEDIVGGRIVGSEWGIEPSSGSSG
jgi:hypothetical protein